MMYLVRKIVFVAIIVLLFCSLAHAQDRVTLQGLSGGDVEKHFGKPDKRSKTKSGKETWSYGRSILLFRDGMVSAWSDAGELGIRLKRAKLSAKDSRARQEREMWKNPWTPQELLSDYSLLNELIIESKQTTSAQDIKQAAP